MERNGPSIDPDRLRRAARTLRRRELQVLILSAGEGLRNEEIAVRLNITPQAAQRLLARALCRLDRALERMDRPWWRFW